MMYAGTRENVEVIGGMRRITPVMLKARNGTCALVGGSGGGGGAFVEAGFIGSTRSFLPIKSKVTFKP